MSFFKSDVVRAEMAQINELQEEIYGNVFKFLTMTPEDKAYHVDILEKLIDKTSRVKFVFNSNYKEGISSSIKKGIKNLSEKNEAFFISLGDMPSINYNTYNQLIKYSKDKKVIVPLFKGQKGNPVLFPKSFEKKLLSIEGDSGAKKMLEINKKEVLNLEIDDPGIIKDLDVPSDFNSLNKI